MCCSGSRDALRATSSQYRGSNAASGTVCSAPRATPCRCAAISSASVRGDSTPASASRVVATATSSRSRLTVLPRSPPGAPLARSRGWSCGGSAGGPGGRPRRTPLLGDLLGAVGGRQGVDHRVEVPVDDLIQVVGLVADPVIGDPVLREVVGADPLRPVDRRDLAPPLSRRVRVGLLL